MQIVIANMIANYNRKSDCTQIELHIIISNLIATHRSKSDCKLYAQIGLQIVIANRIENYNINRMQIQFGIGCKLESKSDCITFCKFDCKQMRANSIPVEHPPI